MREIAQALVDDNNDDDKNLSRWMCEVCCAVCRECVYIWDLVFVYLFYIRQQNKLYAMVQI